jgi:hypothetical protein
LLTNNNKSKISKLKTKKIKTPKKQVAKLKFDFRDGGRTKREKTETR